MNKEKKNLLKQSVTPFNSAKLVFFVLCKVGRKIIQKSCEPTFYYPLVVKKAYKANSVSDFKMIATSKVSREIREIKPMQLKLAIGYLKIQNNPNWNAQYDDPEQLVSLHRWGWLLHLLLDEPLDRVRDEGVFLIEDWCNTVECPLDSIINESYTLGERLSNAILYSHLARVDLPFNVKEKLQDMSRLLVNRIEYYWFNEFGNHVLNNARALYFSGQYFENASNIGLAKSLLSHALPRLICSDGFLREGSSHYHFLITRWLLELAWFSKKKNDPELLVLLASFLPKMVERCWFFIVNKQTIGDYIIPLIGDVSPDFTWKWLVDLPWSSLATSYFQPITMPPLPNGKGWGQLMGRSQPIVNKKSDDVIATRHFQPFPESGWYRLDWGNLTIIWYVEPTGSPDVPSHGHCDIGSFSLYWKGDAVLIDPGRLNYKWEDAEGSYGVGASAHNSVQLDGYDPFIYIDRSHYPKFYSQKGVNVSFEHQHDSFIFCIEHTGFSRIHGDCIRYKRCFYISSDEFIIEDHFLGEKQYQIQTFFQWDPNITVNASNTPGVFDVTLPNNELSAKFSYCGASQISLQSGWMFPNYGEKAPITTMVFAASQALPAIEKYHLTFCCD